MSKRTFANKYLLTSLIGLGFVLLAYVSIFIGPVPSFFSGGGFISGILFVLLFLAGIIIHLITFIVGIAYIAKKCILEKSHIDKVFVIGFVLSLLFWVLLIWYLYRIDYWL